jgi:hypothetical protein
MWIKRTKAALSIALAASWSIACIAGAAWLGWLVVVFIAQSMTRMLGGV